MDQASSVGFIFILSAAMHSTLEPKLNKKYSVCVNMLTMRNMSRC